MENINYNISEILAVIFSVLIGSGAYISFVYIKNKQNISASYIIAVLLINLCLTYVASELLKAFNWSQWRSPSLPMVAFAGQYLTDWLDKRYFKIFDTAAKRAGIKLDDDEPNIKKSEENEDQ
ncbi:hypothetical protein EG359_17495 [Chryseobacterium joostei]|uniref:Holin n=1 Tax=Chryseobacterium joostei TaxID=112234 RepID=A0A1N7IB90_9FLAO|nr:hypothetical protein [Chryseobacterium joostei]AZB01299.1 hypothetical protein EG359_17495 [Chryseobacterium joostei]SIS34317.1 hypothetical protein SAMN05421768_103700 [Chryseobacterium joostei]